MRVRAQTAMVFNLDKCIGCHTCSIACKNIWSDRRGAEYMWWNNVETKPGTGFPTRWEDQEAFKGGWVKRSDGTLRLRNQSRLSALAKLFYNPKQPGLDNYYEPWTYRYRDLFDAPAGDDQPTAVPISLITGKPVAIEAGPNWDDDLSGSPIYAENDVNLDGLTEDERQMLFSVEGMAMMYVPRICNHCVNPACVAACPSRAIYKRGEDGIVLVNQDGCRGWRACVAACPYKKTYYNWDTGKSEKCILCYPRLEAGEPPACFHSCVGRIRYMGVLLYDADKAEQAMKVATDELVEAQRSTLLDANDPAVIDAAVASGIPSETLEAARRSPIWKWVMEWKLALPLHPEYRTLPMLFYVPPLMPVVGRATDGIYEHDSTELVDAVRNARIPSQYFASLFSAGNVDQVDDVLQKLVAVRIRQRALDGQDLDAMRVEKILADAGLTASEADAIYRLTALSDPSERYVLPPGHREEAIEGQQGDGSVADYKGQCGFATGCKALRGS